MTIDKNLEGAWRICENINAYIIFIQKKTQ
jgi:hypothetical protein